MNDSEALGIVRGLIVGKRGRERAEKLVCYNAKGEVRQIQIAVKGNASRYVEAVRACAPVRIEAMAGKNFLAAWGVEPEALLGAAPALPEVASLVDSSPRKPSKKSKGEREVERIISHFASLLAQAYRDHDKTMAEERKGIFASVVEIAQAHSDRATRAELGKEVAEKSVRIRDRQIHELNDAVVKLKSKIVELAASSGTGDDARTQVLMKLLNMANGAGAAKTEGASA